MDSILDSLTGEENVSPGRKTGHSRHIWLKRIFVLLAAVATLGVLLVP